MSSNLEITMSKCMIECLGCGVVKDLFDYQLDESATLTCPVCSTQFNISATIKDSSQKIQKPGDEPPDELPSMNAPVGGAPSPAAPAPAAPTPPPPALPSQGFESRLDSMLSSLVEGLDLDSALDRFLMPPVVEKAEDKEEWKGTLSAFTAKIQQMALDLDYIGDLGDLVKDLQDVDALEISGENIKLDLDGARKALVKHMIGKGPNVMQDPKISGDLMDVDFGDEGDENLGGGIGKSTGSVSKALEKYFS